ncbi:tRNA(Met) cytidine acetyltransferase, partial [Vibrio alginolyticus]|nr:tRNA(Met) cytidine acetyltransferase [Vibrio alginolyticus]
LVRFWQHNQFCAVKIGSQRDQASGCHSLLMIQHHSQPWVEEATAQFPIHLSYELSETLRTLTPALVRQLMSHAKTPGTTTIPLTLLQHYANGGANYESVAAWIEQLLLSLSAEQWLAVSDVLIAKVLQRHTWQECANAFDGSGRKQV